MSTADPSAPGALWAEPGSADLHSQTTEPFNFIDILNYGFLLAAGVFYFYFRSRATDFLHDDVFYFQRAISILRLGYDGFNGVPETTQPPGLPYIFAGLCKLGACTYRAIIAFFPVFETLGLLVTYTFLRRQTSRAVAIVICMFLVVSPNYFSLATAWIATTFPVFFTSMSALLVAAKLDEATSPKARIGWGALAGILVASSMMIATASLSLIGAVAAKIAFTFFRDRRLALIHFKNYAAVLMLGIAAQGIWAHRKPMPLEWPIQGFPRPYMQQLPLKSGPNPELGYATWRDVVLRVKTNAVNETALLLTVLYPGWVNLTLSSVAVAGPILLILLGLADSLWRTRGDTLAEWYFAGYQVVYLLWPWNMEIRYFFPVAPLAMLYLWRGVLALFSFAKDQPRILGAIWVPVSGVLAAACLVWLREDLRVTGSLLDGLQAKFSLVFWTFSAVPAIWMAWRSSSWQSFLSGCLEWFSRPSIFRRWKPLEVAGVICGVYVAFLAVSGFTAERRLGLQYRDPHSSANRVPPDAEAALWSRSSTTPDSILMARQTPIVSYLSGRKVIWFPPSSNPRLLVEGIRKYKVDYIVSVKRFNSYYLPTDDAAMATLLSTYPSAFRLAEQEPGFCVFQVLKDNLPPSQGHFFDN